MAKITITAQVPDHVLALFLQHIRDFDVIQPSCDFKIIAATDLNLEALEKAIKSVTPPFKYHQTLRKQ